MKGFLAILGLVGGAYLVYAFVLDAGDQATVRSLWGDTTPPGAAKQYGDILTSTAFLKALGGAVGGGILGLFLGSKMGGKKPKDGKK
ncbi:MAG TPA: hypothetical protein VFG37_13375 [Planctomycetota bacterium]|jgi:hypothetical protein|nr:hypothetical protein [Planctomycetota bacterium]